MFCRFAGAWLVMRIGLSARFEAVLDATAMAVVAAIAAAAGWAEGLRGMTAILVTMALVVLTRNTLWAMLFGVGVGAAWHQVIL